MSYIPPHKRHSRGVGKSSPLAESLAPQFNRKWHLRPFSCKGDTFGFKIYADQGISKWFSVGSTCEGNQFPSFVNFEPYAVASIGREGEEKPLALVNTNTIRGAEDDEREVITESCELIVENLLQDLLSSVEHVKNKMNQDLKEVKPKLLVRLGKVLFHGSPEINRDELPTEIALRRLKRLFYTNVSGTYIDNITEHVIPLIGLEFEEEKDVYHVKLSDTNRQDVLLSCKCIVVPELNNLEVYKIELNQLRHLVVDISCLKENLDMRLMLNTKKNLTKLTDDEIESVVDLVKSAVVDQDVKGGLRWPRGKSSSGDRFRVVGVWHTVAKSYVSPSMRLKIRTADRFDFRTLAGETTKEVILMLKQVASELLRGEAETEVISNMLNDHLKLIWNHFLRTASCSS